MKLFAVTLLTTLGEEEMLVAADTDLEAGFVASKSGYPIVDVRVASEQDIEEWKEAMQ